MGVDRTGTDDPGEAADQPPPPDHSLPPDRPGAEGAPSRADSRDGAAAANDTSDQAAEDPGEDRPDTPEASQETADREGNTTIEGKPETPGTSESDEGLSNDDSDGQHASGSEVGAGGRSETKQSPEETIDVGGGEQASDGWASPRDSSGTAEMGKRSTTGAQVSETQVAPRDSRDVHRDGVAGEARRDAEPVAGVSEASVPAGIGEEQPPATDAVRPSEDGSDVLQEKNQAEEAATGLDTLLTKSEEAPDRRLGHPDDGAQPGADAAAEDIDANEDRPLGDRLMIGDISLREYLHSQDGAVGDSDVVGEPWTDPTVDLPSTGKDLVETDSDRLSRFERFRKEGHKKLSDALDVTEKGFDLGVGAFARPPTHAETRTAQPDVVEAPHHAVTAGEAAAGLLVAGVLVSELVRWGRGKITPETRR